MARDVSDDTYYVSSGGKIPVKWTAPEVCSYNTYIKFKLFTCVYTYDDYYDYKLKGDQLHIYLWSYLYEVNT